MSIYISIFPSYDRRRTNLSEDARLPRCLPFDRPDETAQGTVGSTSRVSSSNCVVTVELTYEILSIQNRISGFNGGRSRCSRAETFPCVHRAPGQLVSCTSPSYTTRNSIPSTRFETDQTTRRREKWKNRITTNIGRVSRKRPPEKWRSTSTRSGMHVLRTKCPTVIDHA